MKIGMCFLSSMLTLSLAAVGWAGDDKTIPVSEKEKIKATMVDYIKANSTRNGNLLVLDSRKGKTIALTFDHVHAGIEKHADGFIACVDMLDRKTVVDLDFVVSREGEDYRVSKIAIHQVAGVNREGHLDH